MSTAEQNNRRLYAKVAVAILVFIALLSVLFLQRPNPVGENFSNTLAPNSDEKIQVDLYMMSKCGFSIPAVTTLKKVVGTLGPNVKWRLSYVGSEDKNGLYSLHGPSEVEGDLAQVCAQEHAPDKALDFIVCMGGTINEIPGNWAGCANRSGIDSGFISSCMGSDDGRTLLASSFRDSAARGVSATPTVFIGGQQYTGKVRSSDMMRYICGSFRDKPSGCADVPAVVDVEAIILSDHRCGACENKSSEVRGILQHMVPGMRFRELDLSAEEGRGLYDRLGLDALPAVLINESIVKNEDYGMVKSYLEKKGEFYALRITSAYVPA